MECSTFNSATKSAVSSNVNFEILSTISLIFGSATAATAAAGAVVLCHRLAIIGAVEQEEEEHVHFFAAAAAVATAKRADRAANDIPSWVCGMPAGANCSCSSFESQLGT